MASTVHNNMNDVHNVLMVKKGLTKTVEDLLYWTILIISILGNFVVSIALVPFLITLEGWPLYFCTLILGSTFGWMLTFILFSIEKLQPRQKVMANVLIPAVALINIVIITTMSNKLILLLKLATGFHSPIIIGATYVIGYTMPSFLMKKKKV